MRYVAMQDGEITWAEKHNNRWFIGGRKPSGLVRVLLEKDGKQAWFRLTLGGYMLTFEDWKGY